MAHTNEEELQEVRQLVWDILRDEVPQKIEGWTLWYDFSVEGSGHLICIEVTLMYSYELYNAASSNHVRFMITPDSPLIVTQTREYICSMVKQAIHYIIDHRRSVLETQRIVYPPSKNGESFVGSKK